MINVTVGPLYQSRRIDAYLTEALKGEFSRGEIHAALKAGAIKLNGKAVRPSEGVTEGDKIEGELLAPRSTNLVPESLPITVLYEDDTLMVIDKASGMVVHPGAGTQSGTLVHALLGRGQELSSESGDDRPGIVHRLDKDTSGLIIVAKNNIAHRKLQAQFQARTVSKTYLALVKGRVEFEEGRVNEPIGRHPHLREKKAVVRTEKGREAETHYRVVKRMRYATLLEVRILTGRTHQIRVHMTHIGHPVVGDAMYGGPTSGGKGRLEGERLALHASKIEFEHPKTGKLMKFESPVPDDLAKMIRDAEAKK